MPTRTKLRAGVKSILKLAAPIGAANLAIVCSGTIDTIMAGQTSAEDLAGVALGIAVATWISISLAGILQGVSPISGFAFGAKRFREVGDSLHQCLYLAVGLAVPGLVLTLQTKMWMAVAETSGLVAEIASQYLLFAGLALPAILCGRTFIAVNAAVSRPAASMFVTLGIVVLKIPVNWFCMNKLGFGGAGTGLSTCMLSWLALGAYVLIWRIDPYYRAMRSRRWCRPSMKSICIQLKIGVPIGLSIFFEMTSYTLMAIFIARFGAVSLASHQIVANLVWLYYVVPFAVGVAGTVLVSQSLGAGSPESARYAAFLVMIMALFLAVAVSIINFIFRSEIASLYSSDEAVQKMAVSFITVASAYHIADAIQCSGSCVLRGYRITLIPMLVHSCLLCGVGLSLGSWFAGLFPADPFSLGALGFWIGAAVGLAFAALVIGPFTLASANRQAGRRVLNLHLH